MKRNIGCIALDSSLAGWLFEQLRTSQIGTPSTQELMEGLRDLMEGNVGSLMLELEDGWTPLPESNTICCGALCIDLRLRRVSRDGIEMSFHREVHTAKILDIDEIGLAQPLPFSFYQVDLVLQLVQQADGFLIATGQALPYFFHGKDDIHPAIFIPPAVPG